jgi:glutamate dehydrogenase
MDLTNQLSDGVDVASFIQDDLYSYFPQIINDKFRDYITNHSLKNAIIITYLANDIVNRMGVGFIHNTQQQTGASVSSIAKAYLVVRESFKMPDIWQQIEQLDNKVLATEQLELMVILKSLMERCILWVLRNGKIDSDESSVRSLINRYHDEAVKLWRSLDKLLKKGAADNAKRSYDKLIVAKIPKDIARLTSSAIYMHQSFALIEIANRINKPCSEVATIYYSWAEVLKFHVFREKARNMSVVSVWDNKARDMFIEALDSLQRTMTSNYFADDYQTMEAWQDKNSGIVNNCTNLMLKLEAQAYASSSELMVFLHNLQSILNTLKS